MEKLKTLVIHIADRSTDFLKPIYADQPNWTIINSYLPIPNLNQIIYDHDRIIMMGHGAPMGLFGPGLKGFVINESHIESLKTKQLIAIWCNADIFFTNHNLHGFYTGMIISEISEALYMGINESRDILYKHVKEANELLATTIRDSILMIDNKSEENFNSLGEISKSLLSNENGDNKVIRFNNNRLYQN